MESGSSITDLDELEREYDQYKAAEQRPFQAAGAGQREYELREWSSGAGADTGAGAQRPVPCDDGERKLNMNMNGFAPENGHVRIPSFEETSVGIREYYDHSLREYASWHKFKDYLISIFPIVRWLPFYNLGWGIPDLIAGITVGCVLVPQSMSYAQIASLPPQYGLYSSFVGAFSYALFATSKDVCIGPVAVMSLETAKAIARVTEKYDGELPDGITAPIIATCLSLLCGIVATGVGLLRLGFLVELISSTAVAGFMTGSALNILWGQIPGLMGYSKKVNTRAATYKVVINTLKHLPDTKLDAVFGLIPLFILYIWKFTCNDWGPRLVERYYNKSNRGVNHARNKKFWNLFFFYGQTIRNAVVIILFTGISYAITKDKRDSNKRPISVLGTVPKGLKNVGVIKVPEGLLSKIVSELPASVIVLLLEHIAIAKSFGRINEYKVVPDQELIAIGFTNLIGTFFNAYPATGSFSRSALKAKCNVKTPFSGVFTGSCVLLALYCLTGAFFYIPKATLSAVIIHAVSDLIASYQTTWTFYKLNPLDFICFITTVFITVFSSIENGIYFAISWSAGLLLLKICFPAGQFLGKVEVAEVVNPLVDDGSDAMSFTSQDDGTDANAKIGSKSLSSSFNSLMKKDEFKGKNTKTNVITKFAYDNESDDFLNSQPKVIYHQKWIPLDHKYTRELNPDVILVPPPPGVIVYRLSDSYTYINCSRHFDIILDEVKRTTKRGQLIQSRSKGDRPWNDPGEWKGFKFHKNWVKAIKANLRKLRRSTRNAIEDAGSDQLPPADIENSALDQMIPENRDQRPLLKIICLDFSQVAQTDATAIQSLIDLRKSINRYADRQVEFHFAGILSSWVKRALINAGFGTVNEQFSDESIIAGHTSYHVARTPRYTNDTDNIRSTRTYDVFPATGTNLPFFHVDIPDFSQWDI